MTTTTLVSLARVTFNRRFISVSCIIFIFFAMLNANPAKANIITALSGTSVHIANKVFDYISVDQTCGTFNYKQRMVIDGKTELVLTESIYEVGTYTLTFIGVCDGYNLYGVGSCACLTTDAKIILSPDFKITPMIENTPTQIFKTEQIQLIITPKPIGFLCIRKKVINKESSKIG